MECAFRFVLRASPGTAQPASAPLLVDGASAEFERAGDLYARVIAYSLPSAARVLAILAETPGGQWRCAEAFVMLHLKSFPPDRGTVACGGMVPPRAGLCGDACAWSVDAPKCASADDILDPVSEAKLLLERLRLA